MQIFKTGILGVFFIISLTVLAGCSSTQTPRVAPERQIQIKSSVDKVKEQLAVRLLKEGFAISDENKFVMKFWQRNQSFMTQMLLSSRYDSTVNTRLVFNFVGGDSVTVVWKAYAVTNPNSAFERLTELTNSPDGDKIQLMLREIKAVLEG